MSSPAPLPPGQQLVARDKWPVVGEREAEPPRGTWQMEIAGEVHQSRCWSLDELHAMPRVEQTVDIHCVTRWSRLGVRFVGIPLANLLDQAKPNGAARYASFVAYSSRKHSSSLPLAELQQTEALVAWATDQGPLRAEHGGPLRMVVPGRYFYKSVKWLHRIELLNEDRLGFWEAEAGYHNQADPWREQRYLAADLDKREASRLIASRDFAGRDLRSIDCRGRGLAHLNAADALLRNADFREANLADANFQRANLSNAHFQDADLRNTTFVSADLEGANFSGADLRGADLTGASLFGATFVEQSPAQLDATTQVDASSLDALTPDQATFVRQHL